MVAIEADSLWAAGGGGEPASHADRNPGAVIFGFSVCERGSGRSLILFFSLFCRTGNMESNADSSVCSIRG